MKYRSDRQELFSTRSTLNSQRRPDKGKSPKMAIKAGMTCLTGQTILKEWTTNCKNLGFLLKSFSTLTKLKQETIENAIIKV